MRFEIEVPDGIVKFLKSLNIDIQEYLEESIQLAFRADFDVFRNDVEKNTDLDKLIKKYGLENFIWIYKQDSVDDI